MMLNAARRCAGPHGSGPAGGARPSRARQAAGDDARTRRMRERILQIVLPVFAIAAAGYVYGRTARPDTPAPTG